MVKSDSKRGNLYAIRCDDESELTLSSEIEVEAWIAIETLVGFLRRARGLESSDLFQWKDKKGYLANARETYAWRGVIDSIKENDLETIGLEIESDQTLSGQVKRASTILRSKPIMLRVAGEITNALIHSYNNRHAITFFLV